MTTPPGWYPDPTSATPILRWWDGTAWSSHVAPSASPPAQPATPDGVSLADWPSRLGAFVIDAAILACVMLGPAIALGVHLMKQFVDNVDRISDRSTGELLPGYSIFDVYDGIWLPYLWFLAGALFVTVVYHAVFLRWRGATPGKRVLGLRVRPWSHEAPLTTGQTMRRVGLQFVVLNVIQLGWLDGLWPLWDKRRQTLHDKAAGTVVVQVVKASGR